MNDRIAALQAYLIYAQRRNETNYVTRRRVAQFLGYSDSTLYRALRTGKVSDRLYGQVVKAISLENDIRRRSIYYATRMLTYSRGDTRRRRIEKFNKSYVSLRRDVRKYRNRVMKRLNRDDRVLASNLRIPIRVIRMMIES